MPSRLSRLQQNWQEVLPPRRCGGETLVAEAERETLKAVTTDPWPATPTLPCAWWGSWWQHYELMTLTFSSDGFLVAKYWN